MKKTDQSKVKPKKPTKSVKNSTKCSHEEDFDVQYWSDREVTELVSSYTSQRYTDRTEMFE
jgi:hypothetical protein